MRVVHGPAITRAQRYRLKSKKAQAVKWRSWQAAIILTDAGVQTAQHVMPAGTQLSMLGLALTASQAAATSAEVAPRSNP